MIRSTNIQRKGARTLSREASIEGFLASLHPCDFALIRTPGHYVGAEDVEEESEPFAESGDVGSIDDTSSFTTESDGTTGLSLLSSIDG